MRKRAGSGFASADPDQDPDPHQNNMDPQHCSVVSSSRVNAHSVRVPGSIVASFDKMGSGGQYRTVCVVVLKKESEMLHRLLKTTLL
jgi:hypothetical protein